MNNVSIPGNHRAVVWQALALTLAIGFLVISAYAGTEGGFWLALAFTFLLFVWGVADRNIWLACVTGVTFIISILAFATPLL